VCAAAALAVAVLVGATAVAAIRKAAVEPLIKGKLRHTVLAADGHRGKVFKISPEGRIVWEFKAPGCHDACMLENGGIRHGAVLFEVTPDKKVVWQYTDKKSTGAVTDVHIIDTKGPPLRQGDRACHRGVPTVRPVTYEIAVVNRIL